ncbi:MAG: hypothetical protein SPK71_04900 [Prevotella sp.]|nr:hypothetical protein [Prevotella sp.]MDY6409166.1 hypothetical protein [Prevotella sp.]
MKQVRTKLMMIFMTAIVSSLVVVLLFELNILQSGILTGDKTLEFVIVSVMELATLILIPLALYLFKIKRVRKELVEKKEEALGKWGAIRIMMLADTMFVNTFLYYMFMNVTFAYMAIILLLSLAFIFPTNERCEQDVAE